jgi:hypothetical protein
LVCKNICLQYQAQKHGNEGRYEKGQKRCQTCGIFLNWEGNFCPCCGYRLRGKPRNTKYKDKMRTVADTTKIKTIYSGSGKDPKLHLQINQTYLKSVPRLSSEQFRALKESIDAERRYVITSNLKRRQLQPFQMVELSQSLRREINAENRENANEYLSKVKRGVIEKMDKKQRLENTTSYKLATITGLGSTTIDKANYVIDHGTEKEIELARSGEMSLERVFKKVVNRRRQDPDTIKRSTHIYPPCEKCGNDTRFKGKCHVHKHYCCRSCSWGK